MSTAYPARRVQNVFNLLLRGDMVNLSLINRAFSFLLLLLLLLLFLLFLLLLLLLLLFTYFKTRFRT